jgi:hypothetical protein
MHAGERRAIRVGLTTAELVIVVLIIATLLGLLLPALAFRREEERRIRCAQNLKQLANGIWAYFDPLSSPDWFPCPLGRGRTPGDYNGAEWLAALYWTGVVSDPSVFLCPSSGDTNHSGLDLGSFVASAAFSSQTVSYAAMHYKSRLGTSTTPLPIGWYLGLPPTVIMASDDTQGDINHGTLRNGGMSVVFFDSHVEFRTNTELDLKRAVGQDGGPLQQLGN